jgi:hypothetical protein
MQPLWCRANIYHSHLECVGLVGFEACEFDNCWRRLEDAVGTHCVKGVVDRDGVRLYCFCFGKQTLLHLNNVFGF